MKRIIDIDEAVYEAFKIRAERKEPVCCTENAYLIQKIIEGTPYNPSGDLISRDALKKAIENSFKHNLNGYDALLISEIDEFINNAPTIEPERPQGEWIFRNGKYRCTACGEKAIYRYSGSLAITQTELLTQFCPNCGADMRKVIKND